MIMQVQTQNFIYYQNIVDSYLILNIEKSIYYIEKSL